MTGDNALVDICSAKKEQSVIIEGDERPIRIITQFGGQRRESPVRKYGQERSRDMIFSEGILPSGNGLQNRKILCFPKLHRIRVTSAIDERLKSGVKPPQHAATVAHLVEYDLRRILCFDEIIKL